MFSLRFLSMSGSPRASCTIEIADLLHDYGAGDATFSVALELCTDVFDRSAPIAGFRLPVESHRLVPRRGRAARAIAPLRPVRNQDQAFAAQGAAQVHDGRLHADHDVER